MPDLSSGFDIPNPYGLLAADFGHDMTEYGVALRYLSDLAGGTPEHEALEVNGANGAMLVGWQRVGKFRRVLDKCRKAGESEREAARARDAAAATEAEGATEPQGQTFVPLEDVPVNRSVFTGQPNAGSWGSP